MQSFHVMLYTQTCHRLEHRSSKPHLHSNQLAYQWLHDGQRVTCCRQLWREFKVRLFPPVCSPPRIHNNILCTDATNDVDLLLSIINTLDWWLVLGCRVHYNNISDFCSYLQDTAVDALLGDSVPTHVATFGDSSVTETGDWVEILTDDVPVVCSALLIVMLLVVDM